MNATVSTKALKSLGGGRVRVSGDVTLADLYEAMPGREIHVEPLSARQPLADFLADYVTTFGSSQGIIAW